MTSSRTQAFYDKLVLVSQDQIPKGAKLIVDRSNNRKMPRPFLQCELCAGSYMVDANEFGLRVMKNHIATMHVDDVINPGSPQLGENGNATTTTTVPRAPNGHFIPGYKQPASWIHNGWKRQTRVKGRFAVASSSSS